MSDATDAVSDFAKENPTVTTVAAGVAVAAAATVAAPAVATALAKTGVLGAASTGAQISSLSGAAQTSAALAKLGGGAKVVGGLGMTGGTAAIGTAGGAIGTAAGSAISTKSETSSKPVKRRTREIEEIMFGNRKTSRLDDVWGFSNNKKKSGFWWED